MSNVAMITIHVLVNSEDVPATFEQLKERICTHETAVECIGTVTPVPDTIIKSVETGTYAQGSLVFKQVAIVP